MCHTEHFFSECQDPSHWEVLPRWFPEGGGDNGHLCQHKHPLSGSVVNAPEGSFLPELLAACTPQGLVLVNPGCDNK